MDYQVFASKKEAQAVAGQMRGSGWPKAQAVRVVDIDGRAVWVVAIKAARMGDGTPPMLRQDGYVR